MMESFVQSLMCNVHKEATVNERIQYLAEILEIYYYEFLDNWHDHLKLPFFRIPIFHHFQLIDPIKKCSKYSVMLVYKGRII